MIMLLLCDNDDDRKKIYVYEELDSDDVRDDADVTYVRTHSHAQITKITLQFRAFILCRIAK